MLQTTPSTWLTDNVHLIPPGEPVLDVAAGNGRNALYLAAAGWRVRAVDRSLEALTALEHAARARGVSVMSTVVDLESGSPSLGHHLYGAVLVFKYLHRPLMPILVDAVAPGGVLIYETFTVGQALRGHPKNPDFLLHEGELAKLVAPLHVVAAREGEFDGKLTSAIVATRL